MVKAKEEVWLKSVKTSDVYDKDMETTYNFERNVGEDEDRVVIKMSLCGTVEALESFLGQELVKGEKIKLQISDSDQQKLDVEESESK